MADNSQVTTGAGDFIRDIDRGAAKTQVVQLDAGGAVESLVSPSNPLPVKVAGVDTDQFDDDGYQYVNPNVPGADIATGDKQTQILSALGPLATGVPVTFGQGVTVSNFPATQAVSGSVAVVGNLIAAPTPGLVQDDDKQYDDDGIPYMNPNVPGADIATGDRQNQIIGSIQAILSGIPCTNWPAVQPVSLAAIPLPVNASLEMAGQVQRIADFMELVLLELRVISHTITQLGQPVQDGPEQLRNDPTLFN
jgi:predicted RecA/RadA family phage recombinase